MLTIAVNQAVFIAGYKNVNQAEIFRPKGQAARIAGNDRRALRVFRRFLCVDFLTREDTEIAAVLRVKAGATIFVTDKGVILVAVHGSPAALCGLLVRLRFAVALVKRNAGNVRHKIAHFPLFLDFPVLLW